MKSKGGIIKKQIQYNDENLKNVSIIVQSFKNEDFEEFSNFKNKDLVPGQYEGGIKVWECSLDLCNFLPSYVGWFDLSTLNVLELGCGHGLPGLYFLLRGAKVMFQDFNSEVLNKITKSYISQINCNYNLDLSKNSAFINGDWSEFNSKIENTNYEYYSDTTKDAFTYGMFDIIVSADTIYNINNYESFYSILKYKLKKPGICFICSKKFYFGVGGGTSQFIDFVKSKGDFSVSVVNEYNDGISNIRQIIEIKNN
jgi:2-polyprenyl-3-methyl-5-hydroxy-6-metoxy-1,4-benzoquinol methylase